MEATASKQPSKSVVIGDVVEKNPEDTKKEVPSTPKLKDEDDDIDDGDKKPAAKVKSDVKKTIVAAVTMEEATYSNERMKKALVSQVFVYSVLVLLMLFVVLLITRRRSFIPIHRKCSDRFCLPNHPPTKLVNWIVSWNETS